MSDDTIEKLAFLALGWLLGLLAPVIVEGIKRRKENILGRKAILSELQELGCLLSTAAYGVRMKQGTVDRTFLEWIKSDLERYATSQEFQAFIPNLRTQLTWTDEDIKKVAHHTSSAEGQGTMLQHYPVPLLDSRVSAIWSFDTDFQRKLLAIRQNIALLDDLVERSRKYFDMTFTKLEGNNYQLVAGNQEQACSFYADRAIKIINMIRALSEA